jgi:N-sulfoglucosamine sulfohydrolase
VAKHARAFFDAARNSRPFYLTLGFVDPHWDTTRGGFGTSHVDIDIPHYRPEDIEVPPFLNDIPEVRAELAEYYRSISRFDTGVSLILTALEQNRLAESTLVCMLGDNRPPFINSKTTLVDTGICLPLIVRSPGAKPGVVNPNLISYIDYSLLFYTGQAPKNRSPVAAPLRPVLGDHFCPSWNPRSFSQVANGNSMYSALIPSTKFKITGQRDTFEQHDINTTATSPGDFISLLQQIYTEV